MTVRSVEEKFRQSTGYNDKFWLDGTIVNWVGSQVRVDILVNSWGFFYSMTCRRQRRPLQLVC